MNSHSRSATIRALTFLFAAALTIAACSTGDKASERSSSSATQEAEGPRLNEIQVIGSHNSYHQAVPAPLFTALADTAEKLGDQAKALGDINEINYSHAPLEQQLDRGIRAFELDIWADPVGGLFANPLSPALLQIPGIPAPQNMSAPGMKVLHIVDIDFVSTCETLVICLQTIRTWSDAHPDHTPIFIQLELKDEGLPKPLDATQVVKFDAGQMDAVDTEIRSVFSEERIISPDDVRGNARTLNEAINTTGWPLVSSVLGQVVFFMDNGGDYRDTYLKGHPSLEGRVLFTSSGEDQPDGAFLKVNEPEDGTEIRDLVERGYIIRTRADGVLEAADSNYPDRFATALAAGAQVISSDFPPGEPAPSGYEAVLPGSAVGTPQVRCNPIGTQDRCTAELLEAA